MSKTFSRPGPDSGDTLLTLGQKWLKQARQESVTNLIPPGSTYDFSQNFFISVTPNHTYRAVLSSPNDSSVSDPTDGVFGSGPGTYTFTPTVNQITFHGTSPFIAVTATLVFIS